MKKWAVSDKISAVSAICAILVFGFGVYQYRSSENWKRSEFVSAQIKDFHSDKINESVLLMMDYDPALVELFPERQDVHSKYVFVSFNMFIKSIDEEQFTESEFRIRQYFEHFLTSLSRFNYFIESGAIKPEELCADFSYPVDLMTGDVRELKFKNTGVDIAPFSKAVLGYLARWEYSDITKFMQKIGGACKE